MAVGSGSSTRLVEWPSHEPVIDLPDGAADADIRTIAADAAAATICWADYEDTSMACTSTAFP